MAQSATGGPVISLVPSAPLIVNQTTSIFELFAQVDQISAQLAVLIAQAPTYAQFGASLRGLSQQVTAVQQQSVANNNLLGEILVLIEAIITGMGTNANQNIIIQALKAIEAALAPTAPKSIDLDITEIETLSQPVPQRAGP